MIRGCGISKKRVITPLEPAPHLCLGPSALTATGVDVTHPNLFNLVNRMELQSLYNVSTGFWQEEECKEWKKTISLTLCCITSDLFWYWTVHEESLTGVQVACWAGGVLCSLQPCSDSETPNWWTVLSPHFKDNRFPHRHKYLRHKRFIQSFSL